MRRLLLFSILWLSLSLAGCDRAVNRSAERRICEALPGLLGSARQYRVHIDASSTHTVSGHLDHVSVDSNDLQLTNGLLLDHLHLDLNKVDYDTHHRVLHHIDSATFEATIGQNSLDEFLAGEAPPGESLRQLRVRLLAGNQVVIDAQRETPGLAVPFQIAGPIRITGPTRIEIDATRLKVVGIPITGIVLRFVKSHFEAAVDLNALPFPVQLSSVATAPGALTLTGTADVEALAARSEPEATP